MKKAFVLASVLVLAFSGSALAFHGGGVAHCDGCHSMHGGAGNGEFVATDGNYLLNGADPSSACLNCHDGANGYHVSSTDGSNENQGGDFFWVKSDAAFTYGNGRGGVLTTVPDNKGHNMYAAAYGLTPDATLTQAPGGVISSATFGCTDCHDPHGQQMESAAAISASGSYGYAQPTDGSQLGNFRLLGDAGFKQITAAAPVAASKNKSGGSYGSWTNYGSGMSAWCGSCHISFKSGNTMHPAGPSHSVQSNYNTYKATGQTTTNATAFDALVPFERGFATAYGINPEDPTGAANGGNVMCLSCHRAHASAHDNALRWDATTSEFIAESASSQAIYGYDNGQDPASTDPTVLAKIIPVQLPNASDYYKNGVRVNIATEYGEHQRSLCNKCHGWD